MNTEAIHMSRNAPGGGILSPRGFVLTAVIIGLVFAVCELAGLREHTTIISGTLATADGSARASAILAALYMLAWFGFVLVAPILLVAAGILGMVRAFVRRRHYASQQH